MSTPHVDAALVRVRAAFEWRFTRPWNAAAAFIRLVRLHRAMRAAARGTCPAWIVVRLAHEYADHVRGAGMPLAAVRRMRRN